MLRLRIGPRAGVSVGMRNVGLLAAKFRIGDLRVRTIDRYYRGCFVVVKLDQGFLDP